MNHPIFRNQILIVQARWRRALIAERFGQCCLSASCYRFTENIFVLAVIVAERELRQIERQVFLADMVICSDDSTFQERPERFDIVGVNLAANVLACFVINRLMPIVETDPCVSSRFIGRDQINLVRNNFVYKSVDCVLRGIFDHLADDIAFPRDRADDSHLASVGSTAPAIFLSFLCVAIFLLAADIGFINFHDAHKLLELRIVHRRAQAMADVPRGMQRRLLTEEHPAHLSSRDAFLALEHRVENLEPSQKRNLGVLENRSNVEREAVSISRPTLSVGAFPLPRQGDVVDGFALLAARASGLPVRPATPEQELSASVFGRKLFHQLLECLHEYKHSAK